MEKLFKLFVTILIGLLQRAQIPRRVRGQLKVDPHSGTDARRRALSAHKRLAPLHRAPGGGGDATHNDGVAAFARDAQYCLTQGVLFEFDNLKLLFN